MLSRMANMAILIYACRFSTGANSTYGGMDIQKARSARVVSNSRECQELNQLSSQATLTWTHWCALLANVAYDCKQRVLAEKGLSPSGRSADAGRVPEECIALQTSHPVFARCSHDMTGRKHKMRRDKTTLRRDNAPKASANEFGQKLYGNLQPHAKQKFLHRTHAVDGLYELLARGCNGARWCSPKHAMLAGVAQIAGPTRPIQLASEQDLPGLRHSPGTVRAMSQGWTTPLHMDSKHSSAWVALRKELCGEAVKQSLGTSAAEASRFGALTRHRFAASAILTLHAPNRTLNPFDLNVFRTRWPAMLHNCSVRTVDAYGVGVRFKRDSMPEGVFHRALTVRAEPGDLFLFNSEFFHDTVSSFPARGHASGSPRLPTTQAAQLQLKDASRLTC